MLSEQRRDPLEIVEDRYEGRKAHPRKTAR